MNTDTGGKKPYHFGNLKEALIEQGIALSFQEFPVQYIIDWL